MSLSESLLKPRKEPLAVSAPAGPRTSSVPTPLELMVFIVVIHRCCYCFAPPAGVAGAGAALDACSSIASIAVTMAALKYPFISSRSFEGADLRLEAVHLFAQCV